MNGCAALTTANVTYAVTIGGVTFKDAAAACTWFGTPITGGANGWYKNTVALYYNLALNGTCTGCFGKSTLCNFAKDDIIATGGTPLTAVQADCLNGKTVCQVMEAASIYMEAGQKDVSVPCGLAHDQFVDLLDALNHAYHVDDGCAASAFTLDHLCAPQTL